MKTLTIPRFLFAWGFALATSLLAMDSPDSDPKVEDPDFSDHGFEVSDPPESYGKGRVAYGNLEFENALLLFRQVVAESRDNSDNGKRIHLGSAIYVAKALGNLKRLHEGEIELRAGIQQTEATLGISEKTVEVAHTLLAKLLVRQDKWNALESECRDYLRAMGRARDYLAAASQAREFLIGALINQKKYAEAVAELRLLVKDGRSSSPQWSVRRDLADTLILAGRPLDALNEARDALAGLKQYGGEGEAAAVRLTIARAFTALGRPSEAEGQLRIVLQFRTDSLGRDHPNTIKTMFDLSACLWAQRKHEVAISVAEQIVLLARTSLGAGHPDTNRYEAFLLSSRANKPLDPKLTASPARAGDTLFRR